jgi:hypothetical protein
MKSIILMMGFILSMSVYAQNEPKINNTFLRVYDLQGKRISKGEIISISEESLQLSINKGYIEIPVSNIGSIKTKRSAGNNILIGAAVGTATAVILSDATSMPRNTSNTFNLQLSPSGGLLAAGAAFGGIVGGAIGGITSLFKNPKKHEINGDRGKWKAFMEAILK